jgi:DNA processing protein
MPTPTTTLELRAWLRLDMTPGVGPHTARQLLAHFGLPEHIFEASATELRTQAGPAQVQALLTEPDSLPERLEATLHWLNTPSEHGITRHVATLGDRLYPAGLLDMADPPLLLYLMGRLDLPLRHAVAVVGSRNPTPQGALNARHFAQGLSEAGVTVVSGMALGVDAAAHEGALLGVTKLAAPTQLATVAVVGTGLDRVYPRAHHKLAHSIAQQGWVMSEYPLGTPPLAANFPKRNRLIAGLSKATLVVEAAMQSGSLITARLALEQGKDVMAIPGSIHATQARGCHALIRQGAKLVESVQDVLEDLQLTPRLSTLNDVQAPSDGSDNHDQSLINDHPLLQSMGFEAVSLDALQARSGLDTGTLQAQLMALELDGKVVRMPGGLLQRVEHA